MRTLVINRAVTEVLSTSKGLPEEQLYPFLPVTAALCSVQSQGFEH